jgi:RND family efflux transporter MFP subunit
LLDSHPHHAEPKFEACEDDKCRPALANRSRSLAAIALPIVFGVAFAGMLMRRLDEAEATKLPIGRAEPTVATVAPTRSVTRQPIVLPGDIDGWYEAPIYARVNGYLKAWYVDFGAHVKKGQLLAEIDAPGLDDRLAAAKARLVAAEAQAKLRNAERQFAETTYARWRESPWGVVSEQQTEAKKAGLASADARYQAAVAEADVNRSRVDELTALEAFKRVVAPFDGIVTARNTDVGALINAGSGVGGGSAPELFRIADVHAMRVFVRVPQEISVNIRAGLKAEMTLPQYPNKTFKAVVSTTSDAIDQSSRTLLVELHAANDAGLLKPGTFAHVRFNPPDSPSTLRVPTSTLIFRRDGAELAILGSGNKVELRAVTLGRNLGTEFEVLKGLASSDRVINNPPDSLSGGEIVTAEGQAHPPLTQEAEAK